MKTIVKIELVILLVVVLVAAGMVMVSEGVLNLFVEPVVRQRTPEPIPTEAAVMAVSEEDPVPEATEAPDQAEPPELTAKRYFAYDVREGAYLAKKGDADEKLYPASITKLLTSYVVLQYMKPEDTVVVGDALTLVHEGSSTADLAEGDELTVEQLISGMMLPSGNDAAQVAAVAAGRVMGGKDLDCQAAVSKFVAEMNKQAEALGMKNSHFENPDGWHHENHYTTMNDLVILSKKVLANPLILKYTSLAEDDAQMADRLLEWNNTNMLLYEGRDTYVPNTIGLKTGTTEAAGGCLISAFFEGDRLLVIGVFGSSGYTMDRYLDTVAIYNSI